MKKIEKYFWLFLISIFLSACSSSAQDPNFILTVVAETQQVAAHQTEMARLLFTSAPTLATLRPTQTLAATPTTYVFIADTPTPTLTPTPTPRIRTTWPAWTDGGVVAMPKTGGNSGTYKKFSDLTGLMVIVVRANGVKLRPVPSNAIGGPIEERGSAFTLTGLMNKNPKFDWLYVQVIAANGEMYWVGGTLGEIKGDPTFALDFYYPELTPSPTPSNTPTSTPKP